MEALFLVFFLLMMRRPLRYSRTDTLCPSTTLFRSPEGSKAAHARVATQRRDHPPHCVRRGRSECRLRRVHDTATATDIEGVLPEGAGPSKVAEPDRKSTRLNSSH